MNDLTSKFSLYDILSMVIPGGTILLCLALLCDTCVVSEMTKELNIIVLFKSVFVQFKEIKGDDSILLWIIAFVFSYMVGIVNNIVTSLLWSPFRNCPQMIETALKQGGEGRMWSIMKNYFMQCSPCFRKCHCIVIAFILLISIGGLVCSLLCKCNIYFALVMLILILAYFCVLLFWNIALDDSVQIVDYKETFDILKNECVKHDYLNKYYYVARNTYRKDIFVMEGQVAFMQNMIIPLVVLVLVFICNFMIKYDTFPLTPATCLVPLSLLILLFPAIFHRQIKIYRCVFEDYDYLKKLEKEV